MKKLMYYFPDPIHWVIAFFIFLSLLTFSGCTGCTEELKKEIMEHYASLPKCDRCGKLRDDKEFFVIYGDPDYGKFCSEFCAEEAFTENEEPMEESTTHD